MEEVTELEWCASWTCPSCVQTTDQIMDYEAIEEYDGETIKVTCNHNEDNWDDKSPLCGHEYLVNLSR